tara:strand:+ start:3246 stop:4874 length:1629 start_codon:yes stop_codon:yes gene_type:complete
MKILGWQDGHDVSYCILENGIPIIHEELERFTRIKSQIGDGLGMFFEHNNKKDIKYFTYGNPGGRAYINLRTSEGKKGISSQHFNKMQSIKDENDGDYYVIGHHQSHAAAAFYTSNFNKALIITLDGEGHEKSDPNTYSDCSTKNGRIDTGFTIWEGEDTKIKRIHAEDVKKFSIGWMWHIATSKIFGLSIGEPVGHQAGTVMAMGTIGNPDKYFKVFDDKFKKKSSIDWEKYRKLAGNEKESFDIAAGLQKATEENFKQKITPFIEKYDGENLCFSGGASLNAVLMGKIYDWFPKIKNIHCDPVPYDGGLSLGSAFYVYHHILKNPRTKWEDNFSSYLGRTYGLQEVKDSISKNTTSLVINEKAKDDDVIQLICNQKIVCVFGGGSESGRRALGNRSILADPRSDKMKDIINEKVKHRQWYRPFAPSILKEDVKDWFVHDIDSPYMSFVLKFKDKVKDKVPAVVHLDGTGRLQTVTKKNNPWYYNFIKIFKEKTGVPILLNTSFNDREPIVETPEDAINCFVRTNIDHLYFRDYGILISKK